MTTFIFTLGFHEDHIVRRLHQSSATIDDEILVFTAKPAQGAVKRAYEGLIGYTRSVRLRYPKLVEVPLESTPEALKIIIEALGDKQEPFIVDLSGGMRAIGILVLTALLIMKVKADIYIQPEAGEVNEVKIPKELFEYLEKPLTIEEQNILREIVMNPGITIEELATKQRKSPRTIRNTLTRLRKLLIIQKGRKAGLYPTKWTQIITPQLHKQQKQ